MSRKRINIGLLIFLALAVIFFSTSCEKLKISKLKANHHFSRANNYFTESSYRLAIEEYELALNYNPNLVEAYRFLGESYKERYRPGVEDEDNMGRAEKALEALNKALEIDPTNKEIIHSLGDMYDRMRNFNEAESMFMKIVEMEPTNMDNYYVLAGFYNRYASEKKELGRKAEEMYLRRIETDPESPQGYAYLASFYDNIPLTKSSYDKFDKSNNLHQMRLELDPDNALLFYTIGVNRFQKALQLQNVLSRAERIKLSDESEKALMKANELDPSYSWTYAYINMLYRNIHSDLYPDRYDRYIAEADRWQARFDEIRKKDLERERLERELRGEDRR